MDADPSASLEDLEHGGAERYQRSNEGHQTVIKALMHVDSENVEGKRKREGTGWNWSWSCPPSRFTFLSICDSCGLGHAHAARNTPHIATPSIYTGMLAVVTHCVRQG